MTAFRTQRPGRTWTYRKNASEWEARCEFCCERIGRYATNVEAMTAAQKHTFTERHNFHPEIVGARTVDSGEFGRVVVFDQVWKLQPWARAQ